MKAKVTVVSSPFTVSLQGLRIKDECYDLDIDSDGKRAVVELELAGWIRRGREQFIFPDRVEEVTILPPKTTVGLMKQSSFRRGSDSGLRVGAVSPLLGAVAGYVTGRIAESAAETNGIAGIVVVYRNEKSIRGAFCLIAEAAVIQTLCEMMPAEKITKMDS